MALTSCRCPKCGAGLKLSGTLPPGKNIKCPKCATSFRPAPKEEEIPEAMLVDDDEEKNGAIQAKAPPPQAKARPAAQEVIEEAMPAGAQPKAKPRPAAKAEVIEEAMLVEEDNGAIKAKAPPAKTKPRKTRDADDDDRPERRSPAAGKKKPKKGVSWQRNAIAGAILFVCLIVLAVVIVVRVRNANTDPFAQGPPPADNTDTAPADLPPPKPPDDKARPKGDQAKPKADKAKPKDDQAKPKDDKSKPEPPPPTPRDPDPEDLPVLPVLPPVKDRPILVLDAGGHNAFVKKVLFTPDGKRLITVSHDKTVRVWDVATGETLHTYRLPIGPGDEGALNAAALSSDGKRLAVAGMPFGGGKFGMFIHVLDLELQQVEQVLKGHSDVITGLSFSKDGKRLASCSTDNTARIYLIEKGQEMLTLKGHGDKLNAIAFSPDGTRVATASHDRTVRIWTLKTPDSPRVIRAHNAPVNCVAWSDDGKFLATGSVEPTIRLWKTSDGKEADSYDMAVGDEPIQVTALAFTKNGKELLYTGIGRRGKAGIIDVDSAKRRIEFKEHTNTVMHGSLSPDNQLAVSTGGDDNETYIWKTADGSIVHKLEGAGRSIWGVGWSEDGKSIFWGNTNRGDTIRGLPPLERTFHLDEFEVGGAPKGKAVRNSLSGGGYSLEAVDFFRIAVKRDGKTQHVFESPSKGERIYSVTLLSQAKAIIGGSHSMYLLDLPSNKIQMRYLGHSGLILAVAPSPDGKYFLTGSTDQTLRIWSPDRDEPLLTLFVADREWIAWTPEGYYAASAYGERLMGWQTNNGPLALANYFPAVQFHASLFQPDLLRMMLPAGGLQKAMLLAAKERKEAIASVHVGQVLPPEVAISSPTPASSLEQPKVEVKALARSRGSYPVKALRLLVNGRPYQGEQGIQKVAEPRLGEVEGAWTVTLPPGKHSLAVQAESAVSKGMSPLVEITRAGAAPTDPPNLYLLAVGVSAYPGSLKLHYAASDAQMISKCFQEKAAGVFGKMDFRLLTDRQATKEKILEGLRWLGSVMTPNDVGILYFSGHGARDRAGNFFLIPVDVNPRSLAGSCVSGDVVKKALENMPGKLLAIFDACHSGSAAEDIASTRTDNLVRDLVTDDYGVVVMASSLGREYSLESSETKAGFYTLGLVEGLSGKADYNRDKYVFIHELDHYSSRRVRQLSGGMQNPVTGRPPNVRSFALSKP